MQKILLTLITVFSLIKILKNNEIIITIKGNGEQNILSYDYKGTMPDQIIINGENHSYLTTNYIYNLAKEINKISLMWNSQLNSTNSMFKNLNNIIEFNFSYFNFSEITDMSYMFYNCNTIKNIDLSNINTISVINMDHLFEECESLETLNLTNVNTSSVINMEYMFTLCKKLNSLDLKSFSTSKVIHMKNMFDQCTNLKFLDLSHFDTSNVINMWHLFFGCSEIISINLNHFNTSKVKDMTGMFENCNNLQSIDLQSFNTSSCESMYAMFSGCNLLESLDISNFDTSSVKSMEEMFKNCNNIKSLNISNFNTSSVANMKKMFNGCEKLMILDLGNLDFSKVISYLNIFSNMNEELSYCINESKNNKIIVNLLKKYSNSNCSCFRDPDHKIILDNNKCIDSCLHDNKYKYEYNKICYEFCPNGTKTIPNNIFSCEEIKCKNKYYNYNQTECIDNIPDGYYLNDTYLRTIDKCDIKCEKCINNNKSCTSCNNQLKYYQKLGDILDNNTIINCYNETPDNYFFDNNIYKPCYYNCINISDNYSYIIFNDELIRDSDNKSYYYEILGKYYYFNFKKKFYCIFIKKCKDKYNIIINKKKFMYNCSIESVYKYEYNILFNISSGNDNPTCEVENSINKILSNIFANARDKLIFDIKNKINGSIDEVLSNILEGDKKDLILEGDHIIYQITSTENQDNNKNKNISTINLGECEKILKDSYNISQNESLLIFKIDYFHEGLLIPLIRYEIYHPITKEKLDLNLCQNSKLYIDIPVSINEVQLYKYDPKDEYYSNECLPSTTKNGTDILLNDRQNEFNDNNMSLCEKICSYKGYNYSNKKANCECEITYEQLEVSKIINRNDLLSYEFTTKSNMATMKCYKTLFTKDGIKNNIGSYIILFNIFIIMISGILFYKCGFLMLEEKITEIYNIKVKIEKNIIKDLDNIKATNNIKTRGKKNKNGKKKKRQKLKQKQKVNDKVILIKTKIKSKSKSKNKSQCKIINANKKNNFPTSSSKLKLNISKFVVDNKDNKNIIKNKNKKNIKNKNDGVLKHIITYNDFDLNSMSYTEALKYDKRNFSTYYLSLIKIKHPFFLYFCSFNDYNSFIIRINLFFLSFSIYYLINKFFFDESTIHKIYEDEGIYNFIYLIPYISYSFVISHTLSTIIKYIFLSERNIFQIKKENKIKKLNELIEKVKKCLVIKYICFYFLSSLFLIFCWYNLSSFGAVYKNTQTYLIKNTLISFGFSLIYPFIISIFPSIFRIISLANKNRKCFYKISIILQHL